MHNEVLHTIFTQSIRENRARIETLFDRLTSFTKNKGDKATHNKLMDDINTQVGTAVAVIQSTAPDLLSIRRKSLLDGKSSLLNYHISLSLLVFELGELYRKSIYLLGFASSKFTDTDVTIEKINALAFGDLESFRQKHLDGSLSPMVHAFLNNSREFVAPFVNRFGGLMGNTQVVYHPKGPVPYFSVGLDGSDLYQVGASPGLPLRILKVDDFNQDDPQFKLFWHDRLMCVVDGQDPVYHTFKGVYLLSIRDCADDSNAVFRFMTRAATDSEGIGSTYFFIQNVGYESDRTSDRGYFSLYDNRHINIGEWKPMETMQMYTTGPLPKDWKCSTNASPTLWSPVAVDFCNDWCNTPGKWECGNHLTYRWNQNLAYTCSCDAGCNGCR